MTLPIKGRRLKGALKDLIAQAREKITIVSYSMSTYDKKWFLWDDLEEKIEHGEIDLKVFGDNKNQVGKIVNRWKKNHGARGWYWTSREGDDGLFHIKALIVDESIYLGSANFSGNATKDSAEWGIICKSPSLCKELHI